MAMVKSKLIYIKQGVDLDFRSIEQAKGDNGKKN